MEPFTGLVSLFQLFQEAGVLPSEASWNIRKSTAGLSLILFWPNNSAKSASRNSIGKISKSKKRRMRRLKRKGKPGSVNDEVTKVDSEILPPQPLLLLLRLANLPVHHLILSPVERIWLPTILLMISVCHECPKSIISESICY